MANDLERIQTNLNAAGVEVACPMCGSSDVTIDPNLPAGIPALVGDELRLDRAIRAISIVCTRCGFIRLHKSSVLLGDD